MKTRVTRALIIIIVLTCAQIVYLACGYTLLISEGICLTDLGFIAYCG
jgi:hypothetical protein